MDQQKDSKRLDSRAKPTYCLLIIWGDVLSLTSEMGMIPHLLNKDFGYDSYVVAYENQGYTNLYTTLGGFKIQFIRKIWGKLPGWSWRALPWAAGFDVVPFLISNSKRINALTIYHLAPRSYLIGFIYRLFNRKGFLHLKMDGWKGPFPKDFDKFIPRRYRLLLKSASFDLLSAETKELQRFLLEQNVINESFSSVGYLPNGIDTSWPPSNWRKKEDLILHVGRLGTRQKQTSVVLKAFSAVAPDFPTYRLVLAGSMDEDFRRSYYLKFLEENSIVRDRIEYRGFLSTPRLHELYDKAKILFAPSLWEGSAEVILEGALHGDVILGSDIHSMREVTMNGKFGRLCSRGDAGSFSRALKEMLTNEADLQRMSEDIGNFVRSNYDWSKILKQYLALALTSKSKAL